MSWEEQTETLLSVVFFIIFALVVITVISRLMTVQSRPTNRFHTAHQQTLQGNTPLNAKNWQKCRICKQPVNTDSFDLNTWFCLDCQAKRRERIPGTDHNFAGEKIDQKINFDKPPEKRKPLIEWNEDGSMK